jgi:MFS family permease
MGAILGSCLSSITLNWAGRKYSIVLSGVMFFLSFLLIGLASIPSSVEMILAGRALSGIGVGLAVPSAAIYVAECSSPALRGILGSLPAFLMALGVLIGYVFGRLVSSTLRYNISCSRNIPSLASFGIFLLCSSSPAGADNDVLTGHALLPG